MKTKYKYHLRKKRKNRIKRILLNKRNRNKIGTFFSVLILLVTVLTFLIFKMLSFVLSTLLPTPMNFSDNKSDVYVNADKNRTNTHKNEEEIPTINHLSNYKFITKVEEDIHSGDLILVNNQYKWEEDGPEDLVSIYENKNTHYYAKNKTIMANKVLINALNKMLTQFSEKTNTNNIMVVSGYRDEDYQRQLYETDKVEKGRNYSNTLTKPGHSEHHTGLAIDFGVYRLSHTNQEYNGDGIYTWVNENCYKYGFIVRYPEGKVSVTEIDYEPWHFRYVGKPHAYYMTEHHLCLEEYIDYVKQFTLSNGPLECKISSKEKYEIYFVPKEECEHIPVPKNGEYSISGNNVDGFIVTVKCANKEK